jgi:hypothetical protein
LYIQEEKAFIKDINIKDIKLRKIYRIIKAAGPGLACNRCRQRLHKYICWNNYYFKELYLELNCRDLFRVTARLSQPVSVNQQRTLRIAPKPDAWEKKHNLQPTEAADAAQYTLHKRFTNVEVYLNSLVPAI